MSRRDGMTLVEVMVVIAIVALVFGLAIPGVGAILDLQQRDAAKTIAQTYTWLLDEAAMRNASFRVVYYLDRNSWQVEVGDPDALVFGTPEERETFEQQLRDDMSRYTQRELEEGKAAELEEKSGKFQGLSDNVFKVAQPLPDDCAFAYIYTPQYAPDGLSPSPEPPDDPADERVAYTYIFPNGTAEHTVIRIVDREDPEDGYTIEVEPISGRVHLSTDMVDPSTSMAWLPEEGPAIQ